MRENALLNAFRIKQLIASQSSESPIIIDTMGKDSNESPRVTTSSMGINRQPRRVPKSATESQQVNRQRRNSGSLASSSIASSQSQSLGENEIVVAWSTRLMSLKKSSDLTLFVRTNREVDETIVVNWSAEIATQWSSYENLKGIIEIPIGTDHGSFKITSENIQELIQESIRNTTGSRNINFKRNRSKFELAEIDQIVFRLDEVQHGAAIIKRDARRCLVSIMDDSKYLEEIDLLKMEIQNSTSRLNSLSTLYSKGSDSNSGSLDESINQIEQLLQQHADEITAWKQDLKTKEGDSMSAEKLTDALDSANKNYEELMASKEKLSADFEDFKQRSESTIETMQTSINDKDSQLDETKTKLEKLKSELNDAHQKIQYHERNDQINHEAVQDDQLVDSLKKSINKNDDDSAFNDENADKLNGTGTESTQLNRTKRIPKPRKQSETGSTEVNKVKRVITGNSSTTSSRMGRRARLTSQEPFIVSWSSKLMSQYRKHDLKLHVRSNREVDETVVLRWSAEIATQWSQYEYLRGKIDIPIGTTTGTLAITDENFANFIDPGLGSSRPINVKRRRNKFELSEIDQVVLRLEDIEHGNALIKRDTRRCHIAIIDDSELTKCKSALAQTQNDLQAASENLLQAQAEVASAAENTASAGNDNQLLKDENADLLAQLASLKSQLNLANETADAAKK